MTCPGLRLHQRRRNGQIQIARKHFSRVIGNLKIGFIIHMRKQGSQRILRHQQDRSTSHKDDTLNKCLNRILQGSVECPRRRHAHAIKRNQRGNGQQSQQRSKQPAQQQYTQTVAFPHHHGAPDIALHVFRADRDSTGSSRSPKPRMVRILTPAGSSLVLKRDIYTSMAFGLMFSSQLHTDCKIFSLLNTCP